MNNSENTSPSCDHEWVKVYDGPPESSILLGKICRAENTSFYSSSNIMAIEFRSDSIARGTGFLAEYRTRSAITDIPVQNYSCGGTLTQSSGFISSPLYQNQYLSNAACVWVIRTPPNTYVELLFLELHMNNIENTSSSCD
ncbi:CUB domain-containing protein [Pelobates fuscus]|uniref:CUB domain-containing protein n=1 Tax=Pelobates fuscus TaxID=191477 RepID=UPI002FE4D631